MRHPRVSLRRRLPAWAPYAVAAAWLLAGWLWLVRGAAHPGVAYRPWAFDHHAYSDLLAMGGDRYFNGGRPAPYLEDRIEYPPLLGLAIWGASFAPGGPAGYFTACYLLLAACALAAVALLARIPGADPWWWAASPALLYYSGLNWDLFPIALLLGALLASARGRSAGAAALAALGASAKLFPVVLLPPAAGSLAGAGNRRALLGAGAVFVAVFLAVNGPVAALAPEGWAWFWRFHAGRGAENSAWELLRLAGPLAPFAADAAFLNRATGLLLAAAFAFAAWAPLRSPPGGAGRPVRLGAAFLLVFWVAVNKVWSPQYLLYAFAAGALASAPAGFFWPLSIFAALDYHLAFEARASRGLVRILDVPYALESALRTALLLAFAAWLGRELWRSARRRP